MNKYFRLFGYCALALMAVACSDDEPKNGDDNDVKPGTPSTPSTSEVATVGNVFGKDGYVADINGDKTTMEDGRVVRIEHNSGYTTLEYNLPKIVMTSYSTGSRGNVISVYNMVCNDQGFVTSMERSDPFDGTTWTYDITYDKNGYMTKFVQNSSSAWAEVSELTWTDGNITKVTTSWPRSESGPSGTSVTQIKYLPTENTSGIMLYDSQLFVDADDWGDLLYFCGLLGRPTKNLIDSSETIEDDGGKWMYKISSRYNLDSKNRVERVAVTCREIDMSTGTMEPDYTSTYNFGWKDW